MAKFSITLDQNEVEQALIEYAKNRVDTGYPYDSKPTDFLFNGEYKSPSVEIQFDVIEKEKENA